MARKLLRNYCIPISYFIVLTALLAAPAVGQALWTADGVPVCATPAAQDGPKPASDGQGGAFIVWSNQVIGQSYNIFAQHVDSSGARLWPADGITVNAAAYDQSLPCVASDGAGGIIVAWQDLRSEVGESDIYAQRVSKDGTLLWAADGVPVSTAPSDQFAPCIVSDGRGGAYIGFRDTRNDILTGSSDIYLQHVDSNGQVWAGGLAIATSLLEDDRDLAMLGDGSGGVVMVWSDGRSISTTPSTGRDIYAQRVDLSGTKLWTTDGLGVCTAAGDQRLPDTAPDGSGGVIVCWDDSRSGGFDIYAQRVTSAGSTAWTANGVAVCSYQGNQVVPTMEPDDTGGAIIAWTDARGGTSLSSYDIYAQRVTSSGSLAWGESAVPVCTAPGWQGRIKSAVDGSGGVFFAWSDNRVDPTNSTYYYDIYCQHMDSTGAAIWTADGIAACSANGKQELQSVIDCAAGSAIVCWQDSRTDAYRDVYAQKIGAPTVEDVSTMTDAKSRPDGTWIRIQGKVVTAVQSAWFYIEEFDRTSGIRVEGTGVTEGQTVSVTGDLATIDGERVITNAIVQ